MYRPRPHCSSDTPAAAQSRAYFAADADAATHDAGVGKREGEQKTTQMNIFQPWSVQKEEGVADRPNKVPVGLLDLPVEVFETICVYLDGPSLINLSQTSRRTDQIVNEALKPELGVGRKYWHKHSLVELPHHFLVRILGSYNTLVAEKRRRFYQPHMDTIPREIKTYNWKDIYMSVHHVMRKLKTAPVSVKLFTSVQNALKNENWLAFKKTATIDRPFSHVTTCGSLLIYAQSPCTTSFLQQHVQVYEDMEFHRRGIKVLSGRGRKILSTKIMTLPVELEPRDSEKRLPVPDTILVIVATTTIILVHTHEGEAREIDLDLPAHLNYCGRMPAFFAVKRDYIGIWIHPDQYKLYKVCVKGSKNRLQAMCVKNVDLGGTMQEFWRHVRDNPLDFMPIFEYQTSLERLNGELPTFTIISPKAQGVTITFGETVDGITIGNILTQTPTYSIENTVCWSHVKFVGRTSGFGLNLFWSHSTFYLDTILQNVGEKLWLRSDWTSHIFDNNVESRQPQQRVDLVEIIGENLLMIYAGKSIFMAALETRLPRHWELTTHSQGSLRLDILRRINLEEYCMDYWPHMRIKYFHFDFDRGVPYVFCHLDEPGGKSAFTYQWIKLIFADPELDEVEARQPGAEIREPAVRRFGIQYPKLPRMDHVTMEVLDRVADPHVRALLEAFGAFQQVNTTNRNSQVNCQPSLR